MKAGYVSIFGKPNAGKSTLLNALMGEKLAIVSPKVQTTRHRIKGILTGKDRHGQDYQIIFSDTPGILKPRYKLHERMMNAVKNSMEDADLALLIVDMGDEPEENKDLFAGLHLKVPSILVLNKRDAVGPDEEKRLLAFFKDGDRQQAQDHPEAAIHQKVLALSALKKEDVAGLLDMVIALLPEGEPFFDGSDLSDLPTRFFVAEMIREKIYFLYGDEIPYQATVLIQEFQEKDTLTKIRADIIVQRESQKGIILGEGGKMIKKLGTEARKDIEQFLGRKVFLELFVKARPKWRDNDLFLKEYGY